MSNPQEQSPRADISRRYIYEYDEKEQDFLILAPSVPHGNGGSSRLHYAHVAEESDAITIVKALNGELIEAPQLSKGEQPPCNRSAFSKLCLEFMSYCAELSLVEAQEAELAWGLKVKEFWEKKFKDVTVDNVNPGHLSDEIFKAHQEWLHNISSSALGKEMFIARALLSKFEITWKSR